MAFFKNAICWWDISIGPFSRGLKPPSPFCSSSKHDHHYTHHHDHHHHHAHHHAQRGKTPPALGDGSGHMTLPCCRFLTDCQRIFNQPMLIFNQLPDASQLMLVYAKSSQSIPPKSLCQDCTLSVSSDFDFELNLRCDPYKPKMAHNCSITNNEPKMARKCHLVAKMQHKLISGSEVHSQPMHHDLSPIPGNPSLLAPTNCRVEF